MDEEGETGGSSGEGTRGFDALELVDTKLLPIPQSVPSCDSSPDMVNPFKRVVLTLTFDWESDNISECKGMFGGNEEFGNVDECTKDERGKLNDGGKLFLREDGNFVGSLASISSLATILLSSIGIKVSSEF